MEELAQELKRVVAVILRQRDRYYLQLRDNKPGIFNPGKLSFFGGSMEPSDHGDPEVAARRELKEETSLDVDALILRQVYAGRPAVEQEVKAGYHITLFEAVLGADAEKFTVFEGQRCVSGTREELLEAPNLTEFTRMTLSSNVYQIKEL